MSRRQLALLSLSVAALSVSACSDSTAPAPASPTVRQIQPSDRPALDVCNGGYITGVGRTC